MKLCKDCRNRGKKRNCKFYSSTSNYAEQCKDFKEIRLTNADRIRTMSDEELAHLITSGELCAVCPFCKYYGTDKCYLENEGADKNCGRGIIDWLQEESDSILVPEIAGRENEDGNDKNNKNNIK